MNVKTFLTSAAATAAIVGTIGFAYAQTDTTNRNPDGTIRDTTQPAVTPGTMGTTTTPSSSGTMTNSTGTTPSTSDTRTNSTGTMSNSTNTMDAERAARADRN